MDSKQHYHYPRGPEAGVRPQNVVNPDGNLLVVQREVLVHATWMNLKNMLYEKKLHVNMGSHEVQAGLELTR